MRTRRTLSVLLGACLLLACILAPLSPAWAHKVNVYAYAEGDTVHVRGYFSKGPARNCAIRVYGPDGSLLVEGKTDENGEFAFRPTLRTDLKIVIVAGEGHTNSYPIGADELPDSLPAPEAENATTQEAPGPESTADPKPPTPKDEDGGKSLDNGTALKLDDIEKTVDKIVERKVAPLRKMLLEQQARSEKATFEQVVAGLGIIFGLMGLTMYLRSIWRNRKS